MDPESEDIWKLGELAPNRNYIVKVKLEMLQSTNGGEDNIMLDSTQEQEQQVQFMITQLEVVKESNRVFCDPYSRVINNYLVQNDKELKPVDFCIAIAAGSNN